jgi:hypothetical protein
MSIEAPEGGWDYRTGMTGTKNAKSKIKAPVSERAKLEICKSGVLVVDDE